MRARHGKLPAVDLTWSQVHETSILEKFGELMSTVTVVKLRQDVKFGKDHEGDPFSADAVDRLFTCCPRVEAIELTAEHFPLFIFKRMFPHSCQKGIVDILTAHRPRLSLKSFCYSGDYRRAPSQKTVFQIASTFCETLEVIKIIDHIVVLSPETLMALQSCTQLTSITLSVQAASIDSLRFVDAMPNLRHLVLPQFACQTLITEDALVAIAPYFSQLELMVFCSSSLIAGFCMTTVFKILIKACCNIKILKLPGMCYKVIGEESGTGCSLSICCPPLDSSTVRHLLSYCPLPLISLECDGFLHPDNIELVASEVIGSSLRRCEVLRLVDGVNPAAYNIRNGHLTALAAHCTVLRELSVKAAGGICGLLQYCGASLTKLEFYQCKKMTVRTLLAIVQFCPILEELTLVKVDITISDLLDTMILPDHLQKLCKLKVGTRTCTVVRDNEDVAVRWRNIVQRAV